MGHICSCWSPKSFQKYFCQPDFCNQINIFHLSIWLSCVKASKWKPRLISRTMKKRSSLTHRCIWAMYAMVEKDDYTRFMTLSNWHTSWRHKWITWLCYSPQHELTCNRTKYLRSWSGEASASFRSKPGLKEIMLFLQLQYKYKICTPLFHWLAFVMG